MKCPATSNRRRLWVGAR